LWRTRRKISSNFTLSNPNAARHDTENVARNLLCASRTEQLDDSSYLIDFFRAHCASVGKKSQTIQRSSGDSDSVNLGSNPSSPATAGPPPIHYMCAATALRVMRPSHSPRSFFAAGFGGASGNSNFATASHARFLKSTIGGLLSSATVSLRVLQPSTRTEILISPSV
jgi:hypothetical protein